MRRARTLVAGAALGFAALTVVAPAAHADSHNSGGSAADSSSSSTDSGKSSEEKSWPGGDGGSWEAKENGEYHKGPHGGPHAGVGILDNGAGLATGGVLIAGGVALGAYALRRRTVPGAVQA